MSGSNTMSLLMVSAEIIILWSMLSTVGVSRRSSSSCMSPPEKRSSVSTYRNIC